MCRGLVAVVVVVAAGLELGVAFDLVLGLARAVGFGLGRRSCAGLGFGDYLGLRSYPAVSARVSARL